MKLYEEANAAETNLNKIRAAIQDKLESALTAGEIKEMEQTFRQNLALNALGEMPKWNRENAFQELQAARQSRELDLQTVEALELLEQKAADMFMETKLDLVRAENNFKLLSNRVRAEIEAGYLDDDRANNEYARNLQLNLEALEQVAGDLGQDVSELIGKARK